MFLIVAYYKVHDCLEICYAYEFDLEIQPVKKELQNAHDVQLHQNVLKYIEVITSDTIKDNRIISINCGNKNACLYYIIDRIWLRIMFEYNTLSARTVLGKFHVTTNISTYEDQIIEPEWRELKMSDLIIGNQVTELTKKQLVQLVNRCHKCFAISVLELPEANVPPVHIF